VDGGAQPDLALVLDEVCGNRMKTRRYRRRQRG
jgi:hypothetical protein